MPKVTHYIRDKDWEKYQSIEDKPRWLHDCIYGTDVAKYNRAAKEQKEIEKMIGPVIKVMDKGSVVEPIYRNKKKGKI
jgi:hypothetical protein